MCILPKKLKCYGSVLCFLKDSTELTVQEKKGKKESPCLSGHAWRLIKGGLRFHHNLGSPRGLAA